MKRLALVTAFAFILSACSNSAKVEKTLFTKQEIIGVWVCAIKYDDLNVTTLDLSEFKANGEIKNTGNISDENFAPIKFTYKTEDQGSWDLKGNQLIIDYDLSKRNVTKTTPKKFLAFLEEERKSEKVAKVLADYERKMFNILSNTKHTENSKITLKILKFGDSRMSIQQNVEGKVYSGGCVTKEKAEEYLKMLTKARK